MIYNVSNTVLISITHFRNELYIKGIDYNYYKNNLMNGKG